MFENLGQQRIADYFNNALGKEDKNYMRLGAMYALQRFEGARWFPQLLEEALAERPAGAITFDETDGVKGSIDDIMEALQRYVELVEEQTGQPAIQNELFTQRSAVWYIARRLHLQGIEISARGVDNYMRKTNTLKSIVKAGRADLYTRQQLDEFAAGYVMNQPQRGRPAAKPVTE